MKIDKLNERITIQKCTPCKDEIGNRWNEWGDYFSCAANASTYEKEEKQEQAETLEKRTVTFTVRWCSETARLTATQYRVLFRGDTFNIESVDPMNFTKQYVKLKCAILPKRGDVT